MLVLLLWTALGGQAAPFDWRSLDVSTYPPDAREQIGAARDAVVKAPTSADAAGELGLVLHAWEQFDLAEQANIYLKVTPRTFDLAASGAASPETFFPMLVEAFGADRCAFGSNYPASEGSLAEIVARARQNLASLTAADRDMILGGTAEILYPRLA